MAESMQHPLDAPQGVLVSFGVKSQKQFRHLKREQLGAVRRAWREFEIGCAYVPGYGDGGVQDEVRAALQKLRDLIGGEWSS